MRPPLFPNPFRLLILIIVVIMLLQGFPYIMGSGRAPVSAAPAYTPPEASPFNFMGIWETLQPIIMVAILFFLGRIWFLLEKIAARLERNKLDVNLTMRKDY